MSVYIGNNKAVLVRGSGKPAQIFKGGTKVAGFFGRDFEIPMMQNFTDTISAAIGTWQYTGEEISNDITQINSNGFWVNLTDIVSEGKTYTVTYTQSGAEKVRLDIASSEYKSTDILSGNTFTIPTGCSYAALCFVYAYNDSTALPITISEIGLTSQESTLEISKTYDDLLCAEIYGESSVVGDSFPKKIKAVENPVITVCSKSVTVPYTLRSIGDICDFITIGEGKVVLTQNIAAIETTSHLSSDKEQLYIKISEALPKKFAWNQGKYVSSSYVLGSLPYNISYIQSDAAHWYGHYDQTNKGIYAVLVAPTNYTLKTYFEEIGYTNPLTFQYVTGTSVVTDISETETGKALLSLYTEFPKTKISISCGKVKVTAKIAD